MTAPAGLTLLPRSLDFWRAAPQKADPPAVPAANCGEFEM